MNKSKAIILSGLLAFAIAPVSAAVNKTVNVNAKGVAHAFGLNADHSFQAQGKFDTVKGSKSKLVMTYRGVEVYMAENGGFLTHENWLIAGNNAELGEQLVNALLDGREDSFAKNEQFQQEHQRRKL